VHVHDGFYFRAGLGPALFANASVTPPGDPQSVSVTGAGAALELAIGGTLQKGLVVGGGIYGADFPSPSYSQGSINANGGAAVVSSIGPFADWYVDPTNGFHVELGIGLGVVSAAQGTPTTSNGQTNTFPPKDESGNGISLFAGVGYEWWVADQLSLGVLARLQYVSASVEGSGDTQSSDTKVMMPAILASLTYH
jgi:hypothetical protein